MKPFLRALLALGLFASIAPLQSAEPTPIQLSGIYPGLAMYNNEGECGTGAVVPWAGKLWVITYAPHKPTGSSDKLYEVSPDLVQTVRPESVGGTPANRMVHRESNQLFIGPYVIDDKGAVRVITPKQMYGRHTGNARHLTDPANKIYYATMEEGIYEVDVKTLEAKELWTDEQVKQGRHADLPGYHGKGLYSGHGRLIYANNGDHAKEALKDPRVPSGVLAEWDGKADQWTVVRRNQFTEVTGPGGIYGNANPDTDPVWSVGWDHRSLILMVMDGGKWHSYRLPKASHSYDGAHGWNTEWPRIRDIGMPEKPELLMTMHGMFWHFPKTFSVANSAGIRPRSAYLKVIGDFTRWNDRLVFGCDDSAKSEFLNKRKVKGEIAGPGQSHSNLWFTSSDTPDNLGPATASGAVWLNEDVKAGDTTDPFLFAGWERHVQWSSNGGTQDFQFELQISKGDGQWTTISDTTLGGGVGNSHFMGDVKQKGAEWIRLKALTDGKKISAIFSYSNAEKRSTEADAIFSGLASLEEGAHLGGLVRARGEDKRSMHFAAMSVNGGKVEDIGYYELDAELKLKHVDDAKAHEYVKKNAAIPHHVITLDDASVLITDDRKRRWRLPRTNAAYDSITNGGLVRIAREVATERDLLHVSGTFYELPAENADGFAKVRPVSSHKLRLMDYCSYRGLLILTGVKADAPANNPHIIRSDDGKAAVWAGAIDDLWKLGKPVGYGGPWKNTAAKAGEPSDPFLLAGYDKRTISLSHDASDTVEMVVQVDPTGEGHWITVRTADVPAGKSLDYTFDENISARWLRVTVSKDCHATAQCRYE
ncbi:hypothetical protein DES53_11614 [Roseimicrobium gellanilyticum]|uniref:F5/8 type C domain-containing protein n=1 Tax=Roseimicrobium gellanilyticum TaxID=748857 RepID=A0A366H3X6_9BACT|nr:hypothetical protein [Roseimicrobium gellanilyticum]RBP36575.1 hypothetical protein DES53_11614 [Roseimicrobium gellanilyticum]